MVSMVMFTDVAMKNIFSSKKYTTESIYSNIKGNAVQHGESISYDIRTNEVVFSQYNAILELFIPDEALNRTDCKIRMIAIMKNKKYNLYFTALALIFSVLLSSCGKVDNSTVASNISFEDDKAKTYIEENYGFADNPVYGEYTAHTELSYGSRKTTYDTKFKEDSNGGAVFYKLVKTENNPNGLVCVYLADKENGRIALNATYIYDYKSSSGSHTFTVSMPNVKNRCYVILQGHHLVAVELTEDEKAADPNELVYKETIMAYDLSNGLEEEFSITREIDPRDTNELKNYHIKQDDSQWIYALGYGSYTAEGAIFLSTEQEFCDKANELLRDIEVESITLLKSSWNNRWFGTSVDENGIQKNMVKVDFTTSEPTTLDNGDIHKDITMEINAEKQELSEGQQLEEIVDEPITYKHSTEVEQEPIVMPENMPLSVDVSELKELKYFNIDGFWYSDDMKYVYHIYTSRPDNGMGTLYFANLKSGKEAKHGQVKQTSSYSVLLKAMEDNGFSPEVVATTGNQLKSDEITLNRVDDGISNKILGTWSNDKVSYTFKTEGTYNVKKSNDSYYGFYFMIDETNIVLGKTVKDLELESYRIENNKLIINDSLVLSRQ